MGTFDLISHRIYIVGILDPPIDSNHTETSFERGTVGLEKDIHRRSVLVNGQLNYIGEWHSHPDRHDSELSPTDHKAYEELSRRMVLAGYPETMLVIGQNSVTCRISDKMANFDFDIVMT
jgi:hypothetical protein